MDTNYYEEVFDIEILDTSFPTNLKDFMKTNGISLEVELPLISNGIMKLGLKKITMSSSEINLYIDQIISKATVANACQIGFACNLLNHPELMPKSWNDYILVFNTIFVDKDGYKSFMHIDNYKGLKKLEFGFVVEGFITPPKRARFLCLI